MGKSDQVQGKEKLKVGLAGLSGVSDFFVQACSPDISGSNAETDTTNSAPIQTALWLAENEVMKVLLINS
jgi:hypothetical protein